MSVEITPKLLADLRQKAEDADGIVWGYSGDVEYTVYIVTPDGGRILDGSEVDENYLAHIAAASPAVVLALIDEVERLRDRLDALECPNCGNQPKFCTCELEQLSDNETNFVTKEEAKE